jgi:hypothetical protein
MEDFITSLDLKGALELYLFLEAREDELKGSSSRIFVSLRAYLYDHLSIEEMESPRTFLGTL